MFNCFAVMTKKSLIPLGGLSLILASCGSMKSVNQPIDSESRFDPLSTPGARTRKATNNVTPTSPSYKRGQWVETSMANATFFRTLPKGNARADKVLPAGTPLKVVSNKGTYVKVELDSGDIGYIPEIMVAERPSSSQVPVTSPEAPIPTLGTVPPPIDPGDNSSTIAPPPEVPGTIPTVPDIPALPDPDAPSIPDSIPTVPDIAPLPEVPGITDPGQID